MPYLLNAPAEADRDRSELRHPEAERAGLVDIATPGGTDRAKRPSRPVFVVLAVMAVVAISGVVIAVAGAHRFGGGHRSELNRAVLRYEAVVKRHDWPALERLLAPDFVFHNLDYGSTQDRHGFLAWAALIGDAHPGFAVRIDEIRADGEVAIVRFHQMRSHGRAVERPPTLAAGFVIVRVVDDQIVDLWSNFDEFGLLDERGAAR